MSLAKYLSQTNCVECKLLLGLEHHFVILIKGEVRTLFIVVRLNDHVIANPMVRVWVARARTGLIDADRRIWIETPIAGIWQTEHGGNTTKRSGKVSSMDPIIE